jgi:hypothetical protein
MDPADDTAMSASDQLAWDKLEKMQADLVGGDQSIQALVDFVNEVVAFFGDYEPTPDWIGACSNMFHDTCFFLPDKFGVPGAIVSRDEMGGIDIECHAIVDGDVDPAAILFLLGRRKSPTGVCYRGTVVYFDNSPKCDEYSDDADSEGEEDEENDEDEEDEEDEEPKAHAQTIDDSASSCGDISDDSMSDTSDDDDDDEDNDAEMEDDDAEMEDDDAEDAAAQDDGAIVIDLEDGDSQNTGAADDPIDLS